MGLQTLETIIDDDDLEVKKEAVVNVTLVQDSPTPADQLLTYFSDWKRLKVAVAWLLRWKKILLQLKQRRNERHVHEC